MAENTVNTPTAEYVNQSAGWVLPRTLMGGTKAMRAAGKVYLPQEPKEKAAAYQSRLKRTTLFNAFRKTVKDMTGKVFDKPVTIGKDVPPDLVALAEDIDNAGRHLNVFACDVFFDTMQTNVGYILTEAPPKPIRQDKAEPTRQDYIDAKWRPYLCYLCAEEVIEYKTEIQNGKVVPVRVRIRETATEPDGQFGQRTINQVRVLYPGRWEIWREITEGKDKGRWAIVQNGETSLPKITIAPIYLTRENKPPLEDLADLNVAHWQQNSDLRNIAHVVNTPILFGAGFPENTEFVVGVNTGVVSTDPNAKLNYVTHDGAAVTVTRELLKDTESQMQVQGLQLLVSQPGAKTATGEIRDDSKENSPLAMMATALQDALELSFGFLAEYLSLGVDAGGSLAVNKDYGISAGMGDVQQLIDAYKSGALDRQTLLEELKRRNVLSDSVDPATVQQRADAEAAAALDAELARNPPPPVA